MYKNIDFKKINGLNLQNKNNSQSDDFYNYNLFLFSLLRKYGDLFSYQNFRRKIWTAVPFTHTVIFKKSNKLSFVIMRFSVENRKA